MNAADYYGLDELKRACSGFVQCCINVDTVCALLSTAERYIQYKCTKTLVSKVAILRACQYSNITAALAPTLFARRFWSISTITAMRS